MWEQNSKTTITKPHFKENPHPTDIHSTSHRLGKASLLIHHKPHVPSHAVTFIPISCIPCSLTCSPQHSGLPTLPLPFTEIGNVTCRYVKSNTYLNLFFPTIYYSLHYGSNSCSYRLKAARQLLQKRSSSLELIELYYNHVVAGVMRLKKHLWNVLTKLCVLLKLNDNSNSPSTDNLSSSISKHSFQCSILVSGKNKTNPEPDFKGDIALNGNK